MSEVVKRLRDRRAQVWEQAKAIADRAADENRNFEGDEQSQWDQLNAELDALDQRIKDVIDGEQRAKDTAEKLDKLQGNGKDPSTEVATRDVSSDELRAFLRGDGGRSIEIPPIPIEVRNTLVKATNTAGGFTVPTTFYGRLVEHLIETAAVMQTSPTVLNTSSGEQIQVPKTTAHSTGAIMTTAGGEGATIPTSEPSFGQTPLGAYKYGAFLEVSRELITDTGVDLEGYLARQAGRALGNAFGQHLSVGTGSNQPGGVVTRSSAGVTGLAGTAAAPFGAQSTAGEGFDRLISLFHSVISPYRQSSSCAWLMNDTTAAVVRRIKSADGVYAWQPSVQIGQPDTILGKPVVIDPFVASAATGARTIAFGDFSQYFVRLVGGVRFERSDEFRFQTDLVAFRAILRADADLVDLTGAVKHYQHGTIT